MSRWANFAQIYSVLSSLSHYLFKVCCSYCDSWHVVVALTYFSLQQTGWDHIFGVKPMHFFLHVNVLFDLPPGIIRDRAPVETDFGTFATAPVFSAALSGRREVIWAPWSEEVWLVLSGLSTPSPLGVNWSRCSEKLPNYYKRFAWSEAHTQYWKKCRFLSLLHAWLFQNTVKNTKHTKLFITTKTELCSK